MLSCPLPVPPCPWPQATLPGLPSTLRRSPAPALRTDSKRCSLLLQFLYSHTSSFLSKGLYLFCSGTQTSTVGDIPSRPSPILSILGLL